ncbi:hypothetical protein [Gelidibacter salicanalis]|uniref:Gliding motility lipoprotein GldD n=1 Tax=Gelidibacter salicanalis TaxID=291193 RepID=A0A934NC42_9FLAO|nr:hypothetical protein [Gelidibacter salicanalis]MBJ7880320.1 hypothetical protein [Gelidibacter salicanalis]
MKKSFSLVLSLMVLFVVSSCGSEDDDTCTKMIAIPHYKVVNNQFEAYNVTEEVACDFVEPENSGPPELQNFSYEVLYFTFIPDTGHKTSRLKFEIKLNNPNNYAVEGLAFLTTRVDGDSFEYYGNYSKLATVSCNKIAANSSCTLTFDQEYALKPEEENPTAIELVSVAYYVAN